MTTTMIMGKVSCASDVPLSQQGQDGHKTCHHSQLSAQTLAVTPCNLAWGVLFVTCHVNNAGHAYVFHLDGLHAECDCTHGILLLACQTLVKLTIPTTTAQRTEHQFGSINSCLLVWEVNHAEFTSDCHDVDESFRATKSTSQLILVHDWSRITIANSTREFTLLLLSCCFFAMNIDQYQPLFVADTQVFRLVSQKS